MIGFHRSDAIAGVDEVDHVEQRADGIDFHAADHGGFFGVSFGDDHARDFAAAGFKGDGEGSADAANSAVEREFAYKKTVGNVLFRQAAVGSDDSQGHGEVESRAFFLYVGGGEVDGYLRWRDVVAAVL